MNELKKFVEYIQDHCLEEITHLYADRLKESQFDFLSDYYQLPDEEFYALIKKNFIEFLTQINDNTIFEHIHKSIALWKEDKFPGIKRDKLGLKDLIQSLSIRKHCLIRFLPQYTSDVSKAAQAMTELVTFYDYYREQIYQTFLEIQHEDIIRQKEFAETVMNTTVEGISGLDKEFKVRVWNKALAERTGVSKEDILGKYIFDFFPAHKDREEKMFRKAQSGEKLHLENLPLLSRPGFYDMDVIPWTDNDGNIIGNLSFSRDVTEKKKNLDHISRINDQLQQNQEELNRVNKDLEEKIQLLINTQKTLEEKNRFIESIVQTTPDLLTVYNLQEKKNVFANKRVEEYLGYDLDHAFDQNFLASIIHPDDIPVINQFLDSMGRDGKKMAVLECRIKNANGEYRWIKGTHTLLRENEDGSPQEIVGLSKDITDEKLNQQKLEAALNHYLTILRDFPALIWKTDTKGGCNYFNDTWLYFTGKSMDEESGDGWTNGVHPDDKKRFVGYYLENFNQRKPFNMEYRLRRYDGQYRWILDMGKPVYGMDGTFTGYLGVCFDIQDRRDYETEIFIKNQELAAALNTLKKTEEKLLEANELLEKRIEERTKELAASEEELKQTLEHTVELNNELIRREGLLSSIIDQTPVSTFIVDENGTVIRINKAFLNLFEIEEPANIVGKYNMLEDEALMRQETYEEIKKVFQKGEIIKFSMHYDLINSREKSKKIIYLDITIFPIKNPKGKVINAVVQHEDVTHSYVAEQALKKSEEQLRLITDSLPVLISYVDKNLNYKFVNKAYTEWFQKSKEEIVGKKVTELWKGSNYSPIINLMKKALEGKAVKAEQTLVLDQHTTKNILINYIPHKQPMNGKTEGIYALVTDISTLKQTQNELLKKNQELIRINTDLDNFIYTASHDLKAPIVNMEGLIMSLNRTLKPKLDNREGTLFNMMDTSILRLKSTISYLTDVTKIAKNFEKTIQLINIPDLVADVKNDIAPLIRESNANIIENYEVKDIEFVKANLKSVFYNFISNAIKYRSPMREPIIKIFTYEQDQQYVMSFEDNGLGLTESQQTKLFSMFKRIHKQGEGSGIGLYIVKRIVENANGRIEVRSQEDKGSRFTVYLPKNNS